MPGSYTRFSVLSQIDDEVEVLPVDAMLVHLVEDNEKCIRLFKLVYDLAEQEGKHGFSNFLAERMDAHEKHGWMLRSTIA
jgi:starvation-inducible DNA-binding protein